MFPRPDRTPTIPCNFFIRLELKERLEKLSQATRTSQKLILERALESYLSKAEKQS